VVIISIAAVANGQTWQTVQTDLACAVGDWTYFYRLGAGANANKLLVEFEGGGGCWDEDTCSPGGPYKDSVNIQSTLAQLNGGSGVRDHDDNRNPFQDWTHLYIPYCSGDIFTGDNRPDWDVEHRGWPHGSAGLEWVRNNIPRPSHAMITGCSAGGYGATFWAPLYFQLFRQTSPATRLYYFGDSSAGIGSQSQLVGMSEDLNQTDFLLQGQVPAYAGMDFSFSDPESYKNFSSDTIALASQEYQNAMFSVFSSNADSVQYSYTLLGGLIYTPAQWTAGMREVGELAIAKGAGNVASWINPGASHCIIPYNGFYDNEVDGIFLHDWLDDMVNDRPIQMQVDCLSDNSC